MLDVRAVKLHWSTSVREKNIKIAKLMLQRWTELKEMVTVLQIPYKATVQLQKRDLTLSDAFGIWLKQKFVLNGSEMRQLKHTNFAQCLLEALNNRKQVIFNNSVMLCAIYLDPRYRGEILHDNLLVDESIETLTNLWNRLEAIRKSVVTENTIENGAADTSYLSVDLDNSVDMDEILARNRIRNFNRDGQSENDRNGMDGHHEIDITLELKLFQPNFLSSKSSIHEYWENAKLEHPNLYELARIVYAIPPTEVQIERDFSTLEYVFNARRGQLSDHLLDDILIIKLNADLFEIIKQEELFETMYANEMFETEEA